MALEITHSMSYTSQNNDNAGHVSLAFDYTFDFGREWAISIYRLVEPSEIPRPSDYTETLPVAYYLSVDPRYRIVLLTPSHDTVAAVSFASFQKPEISIIPLPVTNNALDNIDAPTVLPLSTKSLKSVAAKKNKLRFHSDRGEVITWEQTEDGDEYHLWVSEKVSRFSSKSIQTRKVGTMRKQYIKETNTRRVAIDVDTSYVPELIMLSTAVAVLKKSCLEEKHNLETSFKERSRGFGSYGRGYAISMGTYGA